MKKSDLEIIVEVIEKTVNGKIDRMDKKLDRHIKNFDEHKDEMKPMLQAYQGVNATGKFVVWISTILVSVAAMVAVLKGWIKF